MPAPALLGWAPDDEAAEAWRATLDAAGIAADVRYEERRIVHETPSAMPHLRGAGGAMWSYPVPVYVRPDDLERAQELIGQRRDEFLADSVWSSARGALLFTAGTFLALLAFLMLRG